jgi:hypothetical protein
MTEGRQGLDQFDDIDEPIGRANALDTLGSVLRRAGHPAMAVELHRRAATWQKALDLSPERNTVDATGLRDKLRKAGAHIVI